MGPSASLVMTTALLVCLATQTEATTFYKDANPPNTDTNPPTPDMNPHSQDATPRNPNTNPETSANKALFEPVCSVSCSDRMESCVCPPDFRSCKFVLVVEELQTFTSYKLVEQFEQLLGFSQARVHTKGTMRTSAGDTYYLDGNGYTPTLPPFAPKNSTYQPPEYGDCYGKADFPNINCSTPVTVDGATFRMFIGINGQMPGPTLIVHKGQTVQVRVLNKLTSEGISVHWHGLHQRHTPWMDGVGFVTQPPIVAGAHFDYIFEANPPGTHWYHSHVGAQRTDGLYGALVIKDEEEDKGQEFIDRPEEFTLSLLDWQLESSLNLFVKIHSTLGYFPSLGVGKVPTQQDGLYLRTHSTDGIEVGPFPFWSGLINGKGRHSADTFSILNVFNVEPGKSYRFRLVGAQNLYAFKFSIENHRLDLIATDGYEVETVTVDYIIIHTGERYDFVLHADQDAANYWIRAETLEADSASSSEHVAEAILHYEQMEVAVPDFRNKYTDVLRRERACTRRRRCVAVNCPFRAFPPEMNTRCIHLDQLYAKEKTSAPLPRLIRDPGDPNVKFFNFGFEGELATSAINAINFKLPTTPYQTYCKQFGADMLHDVVCKSPTDTSHCVHVSKIATNEIYTEGQLEYPSVNFVLSTIGMDQNNNFSHPIHLHGHAFHVVAVRHGEYDRDMKLTNSSTDITCKNLSHCQSPTWTRGGLPPHIPRGRDGRVRRGAIRKDTVIVPAGGYVVIAFAADNPGYWFMHCHIEAHQLEGMALIVQEYGELEQWAPPDPCTTDGRVDINRVGNFSWTVDEYWDFLTRNQMCSADLCS